MKAKKLRAELLARVLDPRLVHDRDSSDWIAVKFKKDSDLDFIVRLFEIAAKANQ